MVTVILAGGASRRMGRDKALLPYGGGTMLQSLIDRYAPLGPVAVSVNAAGRFAFTGAAELPDPFPGQGPLNGLLAGFGWDAAAEALFLTGTDLPLGDPALALRLWELRGDADACLLRRGAKGAEPVFAVYARGCLPAAQEALERGERSFRRMLAEVRVRWVDPAEAPGFDLDALLRNVNTPADYETLLSSD